MTYQEFYETVKAAFQNNAVDIEQFVSIVETAVANVENTPTAAR